MLSVAKLYFFTTHFLFMSKPRFHVFLSCLMRHAWQLQHKKNIRFSHALKHTWKITKQELKGESLPLLTSDWHY